MDQKISEYGHFSRNPKFTSYTVVKYEAMLVQLASEISLLSYQKLVWSEFVNLKFPNFKERCTC